MKKWIIIVLIAGIIAFIMWDFNKPENDVFIINADSNDKLMEIGFNQDQIRDLPESLIRYLSKSEQIGELEDISIRTIDNTSFGNVLFEAKKSPSGTAQYETEYYLLSFVKGEKANREKDRISFNWNSDSYAMRTYYSFVEGKQSFGKQYHKEDWKTQMKAGTDNSLMSYYFTDIKDFEVVSWIRIYQVPGKHGKVNFTSEYRGSDFKIESILNIS